MAISYRDYPVLYVDDERPNLVSLRYAIEDEFSVVTASSGEEALRILEDEEVAILIADQRMPRMSGVELCARAREVRPDTVRMILTAYADLNAAMDAINRGKVSRYITKPWNPDELRSVLRTAIDVYHFRGMVSDMELRLLQGERAVAAGALAAELDHELRQWLMVISGGLEIVRRIAEDLDDRNAARELDSVSAEGIEAVQVAVKLLGRARTGQWAIASEPLRADVSRVVRMATGLMRAEVSRRARFDVMVEGEPVAAITPTALAQVLLNLLSNAWKALPERAATENSIAVHAAPADGRLRLTISDSGSGIAANELPRIFDRYFTKRGGDGTGLGLAIVRKIVDEANGTIKATCPDEGGTTVEVMLPLAHDEP